MGSNVQTGQGERPVLSRGAVPPADWDPELRLGGTAAPRRPSPESRFCDGVVGRPGTHHFPTQSEGTPGPCRQSLPRSLLRPGPGQVWSRHCSPAWPSP
eukprot:2289172-Amphidinium_carterae.1